LQSTLIDLQEQLTEARAEIAALKTAQVVTDVPRASKTKPAPTSEA
jgi:hypothetical protein